MRPGIVLRLVGLLALAALIAVEGNAIRNQASQGHGGHYTVVLRPGTDANAVAKQQSDLGVHIDKVVTTNSVSAYTGIMSPDVAQQIQSKPDVAYLELDSQQTFRYSWWQTLLISFDIHHNRFV